jgi:hypothetical protein
MAGKIFVSYRRATTSNAAGRLADRLMDRFGDDQVFVDVDAIEPGVDFVDVIEKAVAECQVLLVVIGPTWHTVTDAAGRRRLDDPHDPVVVELRAGLASMSVRVIPVLVEGAEMPRVNDLPSELARLARLNAARVEHASFRRDAAQLADVLERVLDAALPLPPSVGTPPPSIQEPILDDFPPETTFPELEQARQLLDECPVDDVVQMTAAYRRAAASGHADAPLAWAELGFCLLDGVDDADDPAGRHAFQRAATDAFQTAAGSGHPTAGPMGELGLSSLAVIRGDDAEVEERLARLIHTRYHAVAAAAASGLIQLRAERGDSDGARAAFERAVEVGGAGALYEWVLTAVDVLDAAGKADQATELLRWALAQPWADEWTVAILSDRLTQRALPK